MTRSAGPPLPSRPDTARSNSALSSAESGVSGKRWASSRAVRGERLVTITAQPAPAGSSGRTCAALAASSSTMSVRVGASSERSNAAAASGCSGMLRGSAPRSRSTAVRAWAGVRGVIPGVAPWRLR